MISARLSIFSGRQSALRIPTALFLIFLSALLFALSRPVEAQQAKIPRVGFLAGSHAPFQEGFRQGLRDLGYIEGRSILVEYRYGEGKLEQLNDLAADLLRFKPDVFVTAGTAGNERRQASDQHDTHRCGRRRRSGNGRIGR